LPLEKEVNKNLSQWVAGDGPERMKLEKLTNELGLNNSVTFKGNLKEEEIYPLFNEATVVIVPSLIESFGLVILEAMQMSRPVIASRVEGIPEVVSEGETGLLVPMQNPVAFYEAIQQLLKDPEEAIRLGKMGRQKAIDHFTLTPYLTQYEALYRELQQEASAISSAS
jgi:glycogen(starch) synthase